MRRIKTRKGFTLVEISLSLAFIAVLSLTIAYIINDTVASYRRGVTLKQINTTGMDLVDDMRATIQNSPTRSVKNSCSITYNESGKDAVATNCKNDEARKFVYYVREGDVWLNGKDEPISVPVSGVFCTGAYSYIWNSGYLFNSEVVNMKKTELKKTSFKFNSDDKDMNSGLCEIDKNDKSTTTCKDFRLLKIKDGSRAICGSIAGDKYNGEMGEEVDITGTDEVVSEEPVDLLMSDEANGGLALYSLDIVGPTESVANNTLFYAVSFVLGTIQGGADIKKTGNFCATPDDYEIENFDYCAINKFNFAVEATGGS